MATISAEKLQAEARANPDKLADAFHRSLVGSYSSLTRARVRQAVDRWIAKEKPEGVIDMFIHGWLNDGIDD